MHLSVMLWRQSTGSRVVIPFPEGFSPETWDEVQMWASLYMPGWHAVAMEYST